MLRDRAHQVICQHLRDPELDVSRIAALLNCSRRSLYKAFADAGESLSSSIQRQRLEGCMRALRASELSGRTVTEVALSWGFNNPSHFSRVFRQLVGQTPTEFRAQADGASRRAAR